MNTRDGAVGSVRTLTHFVDGRHTEGRSGRFGDVYNPTLGVKTGQVPLASRAEVAAAVDVASRALPEWANTSPLTRARVIFKFKELVEKHAEELALKISEEHGKVLSDARGSVQRGLECVEFACGIPH